MKLDLPQVCRNSSILVHAISSRQDVYSRTIARSPNLAEVVRFWGIFFE